MKTNILNVKSHMRCGPGGWTCYCCGPAPKHRRVFAKKFKKKMYRFLDKLENS